MAHRLTSDDQSNVPLGAKFDQKKYKYYSHSGSQSYNNNNGQMNQKNATITGNINGNPHDTVDGSTNSNGGDEKKWEASIWPFLLLFGSVLFSIGNTMLLAYVFRSMESIDRANQLVDGKLIWDPSISGNLIQIPSEGKSIRLNSIEPSMFDRSGALNFIITTDGSQMKMKFIDRIDEQTSHEDTSSNPIDDDYLAINLNGTHDGDITDADALHKTLEIGTKMFVMNKIQSRLTQGSILDTSKLLELDTEKRTIKLSMHTHLLANRQGAIEEGSEKDHNLQSTPSTWLNESGIQIHEQLVSAHLLGSIDNDLMIQARYGNNLICRADEGIQVDSKTSNTKLSIYDQIKIESPEIELDAKNIYVTKGIKFFDSEPASGGRIPNSDPLDSQSKSRPKAMELISVANQLLVSDQKMNNQ